MLIEGILAAVPTPFYPDEQIYFRKLEANVAHYSRSLLSGLLLLGSTGEAVMLDDAESRDVLRVAAEATAPEKVLIAGVGRESVGVTVALAESAAAGPALQHPQMRPLRASGRPDCRTRNASEHHRDQGFQRQCRPAPRHGGRHSKCASPNRHG